MNPLPFITDGLQPPAIHTSSFTKRYWRGDIGIEVNQKVTMRLLLRQSRIPLGALVKANPGFIKKVNGE